MCLQKRGNGRVLAIYAIQRITDKACLQIAKRFDLLRSGAWKSAAYGKKHWALDQGMVHFAEVYEVENSVEARIVLAFGIPN